MNSGSSNGRGWGVIDFPRNQSACWESTVRPEQRMGVTGERQRWSREALREIKREENKVLLFTEVKINSLRAADKTLCSRSDRQALIYAEFKKEK